MRSLLTRPRLLAGLLPLLVVLLGLALLPQERLLLEIQQWAGTAGPVAPLVVTAAVTAGILLLLPSSLLMLLAGFLLGTLQGLAAVWTAGLIASSAAFWIGRTLARRWIERRIQRKPIFMAVDRAIRRKGFLIVLLTRLVMLLPYPALNYTLGLTSVRPGAYLLGTNLGMLAPMFLFVYLGASAADLAAILNGDLQLERNEWLGGLMALALVLIVVTLIIRSAARVLREELAGGGPPQA